MRLERGFERPKSPFYFAPDRPGPGESREPELSREPEEEGEKQTLKPRFDLGQLVSTPGALEAAQQVSQQTGQEPENVLSRETAERNDRFLPFLADFFG